MHPGRPHSYADLPGSGVRWFYIDKLEYFRTAVGGELHGFHESSMIPMRLLLTPHGDRTDLNL